MPTRVCPTMKHASWSRSMSLHATCARMLGTFGSVAFCLFLSFRRRLTLARSGTVKLSRYWGFSALTIDGLK